MPDYVIQDRYITRTTLAQPIHDEILLTKPTYHYQPMSFRARLFENTPFTVAILTDTGDENPGCSITNGIEYANIQ